MSDTARQHKRHAPSQVACAVITLSDSRTAENDVGGDTLVELLAGGGHALVRREIMAEQPARLQTLLIELSDDQRVEAILLTGGTGISRRDQTMETVSHLLTRQLPGYGELFRSLSFQEIGTPAMLSRAIGGLIHQTVVLTMPGSPGAVRLAMNQIILPELGHLVREARK